MLVLCSDIDYQEAIPVWSFPHLYPPHPFLSQIVGYDHGSKPLSMLSTCNLCTFTGTIYKEMYICWKERIQNTFFFLKKDYSFQQLEKKVYL